MLRSIGITVTLYLLHQLKNCEGVPMSVLGCYQDCGPTVFRDLSGTENDGGYTLQTCADLCASQGYRYASMQFYYQCFCGESYGTNGQLPDSYCTFPCAGDGTEICGGSCKNTVMDTGGYLQQPYILLGCYSDNAKNYGPPVHDLPILALTSSTMTMQLCVDSCLILGYRYAGVQAGIQCYCGQTYGMYGLSTGCGTVCSGDSGTICGGSSENTIMDSGIDHQLRGLGSKLFIQLRFKSLFE